jgi:site-specific DNA recombinase
MASDTGDVRCGIYTRVSTPEQAEGDFSSIDNQRQMSEAYIQSQAGQGWIALDERYNDCGFSGGTMERPALDRLLRDAQDGLVDCIVVTRIDRLSRSLLDFARIVDVLDRHDIGFVSVTQQFDTSNSMGKLTLNILFSFAQFEREMIAERTREKMVAARRKGKWTGGVPPLGYDSVDGKLVVNPDEAVRVRAIFDRYLKHRSLAATVGEMNKRGWTTKSWMTKRGRHRNGKQFQKASLRRFLTNTVFTGKVSYQGQIYDGEHDRIVDSKIWEQTQRLLKKNGSNGGRDVRNRYGALLKGILRCTPCDAAMSHTFIRRNGRRYRYYVCGRAQRMGWSSCPTKSIPAEEIERCIYERVRAIGDDPTLVEETIRAARTQIAEQTTQINADTRILKQQLTRLQEEKQNLLESILQGGPVASKAAERLDQVAEEMEFTSSQLSSLRRQHSTLQEQEIDAQDLTTSIAQFDPIWDVLLPRERVRIVRLLIQQVDFDGESGTMGITFQPTGIKALMAETVRHA